MTLKEWVKNELLFWAEEKKKAGYKGMETYCRARIDAAKGMERFIYLNQREAE